MLRRLLARGVRPRWVVAEFWLLFLTQRSKFTEEEYIRDRDLHPTDGGLVARYFAEPWDAYGKLVGGALLPASSHRSPLLQRYAPFLNPPFVRSLGDWSDPTLRAGEGFGWLPAPAQRPAPELFRSSINLGRENTLNVLADFRISPIADTALRELLTTCRDRGICTTLLLVPEHSSLRESYPAEVVTRVNAYLADLSREQEVPVVDTRTWVPDDDFIDMTHALPRAAAPYTERFGREVLRPLMEGLPLPPSLLLEAPSSGNPPVAAH
jgi:hypothetical protein